MPQGGSEAVKSDPNIWVPAIHMRTQDGILGSWLWLNPALAVEAILGSEPVNASSIFLFPSVTLLFE